MPVPTYDRFIEPILRCLFEQADGVPARTAYERAADVLGLSVEERAAMLPSGGQPIYQNRAGWAHDRLKRAGLSHSPRRGLWQLTAMGFAYARQHPAPLSDRQRDELARSHKDVRLRLPTLSGEADPIVAPDVSGSLVSLSPDDRLEQAILEIRESVAAEILEALAKVSPARFEVIVLNVLHAMGYGADASDLEQVGGPGDGGIDGIISLDRLGLEKVYVQAKRWQNVVGPQELQAFYGALAGQKAKKGVFITTSGYTKSAKEFVQKVEGIVLVDGIRLAALMIEYEVGVNTRPIRIPKLDSDYFDT